MTIPSLPARPAGRVAASGGATRVLAALATATAGLASEQGFAATRADADACRPDVVRLCLAAIPDEDAIVACRDAHLRGLSPACRAVTAPSTPPSPTRPGRRTAAS